MQDLILTLHIIVCVLLVILVLLQSGKEGMGVIFGGGNTSVFGSSGAGGILAKLTTLMAIIFVITSLSYTYVTSSRPTSESTILNVQIEDAPPTAPQTPAPASQADQPANSSAAPSDNSPATQPAAPAASSDASQTAAPNAPAGAQSAAPVQDQQNRPAPNQPAASGANPAGK